MVEVTFLSLKFLLCAKDYEKFTLGKVGKSKLYISAHHLHENHKERDCDSFCA